jgi:hypothetical protein
MRSGSFTLDLLSFACVRCAAFAAYRLANRPTMRARTSVLLLTLRAAV